MESAKACLYFKYAAIVLMLECETDLHSRLRIGKLDVSCEGWDRPGHSDILQDLQQAPLRTYQLTTGSFGLAYNLVRMVAGLERREDPDIPSKSGKSCKHGLITAGPIISRSLLQTDCYRLSL